MVPKISFLGGLLNSIHKNNGKLYVKLWIKPQYKNKDMGYSNIGDPFYITVMMMPKHPDFAVVDAIELNEKGWPAGEKKPVITIDGACEFTVRNYKDAKGVTWVNMQAMVHDDTRVYVDGFPPSKKNSDPEVAGTIPDSALKAPVDDDVI